MKIWSNRSLFKQESNEGSWFLLTCFAKSYGYRIWDFSKYLIKLIINYSSCIPCLLDGKNFCTVEMASVFFLAHPKPQFSLTPLLVNFILHGFCFKAWTICRALYCYNFKNSFPLHMLWKYCLFPSVLFGIETQWEENIHSMSIKFAIVL